MDQFRQVGEILGSLNALMVLKHEIQINQRQCCLVFDMFTFAFEIISEEIKHNLRLEDRNTKWKALDLPMKELHKIFKEADLYIRYCTDIKDWWGRAISLHMNRDSVELHIHNLLSCFPAVIDAIETAAEVSGVDQDDMQRRRIALMQKYDQECDDPKFFMWKFGKQHLVTREMCSHLETAWREDRWLLLEKIREKKMSASKHEQRLAELLLRKLNGLEQSKGKLLPGSILVRAQDFCVKRLLGSGYPSGGEKLKEIRWLGESFALRTFYGDIGPLQSEISHVLTLSHPNVLQYLCAFYDEQRKEGYLVMELMSKDLCTYMKENSSHKNRIPFTAPAAVDIMLQIARGMEYLHSRKIYHGNLNPSSILLKARSASIGGFHAKITGFGMTSIKNYYTARSPELTSDDVDICLAPEVLAELEQPGTECASRYTDKADVYSFGMLCFELVSGKVPFEDGHLHGEMMARNIRAGGRPLFSCPAPKYLANLARKCWQTNPNLRPTFGSICRMLRYIKRILVMNPDHGHPDSPPPLVDSCDLEAEYLKKFPGEGSGELAPVSQIPFQMFMYKIVEKEKISGKKWEATTDQGSVQPSASVFEDNRLAAADDLFLAPSDQRSVCSDINDCKDFTIAVDQRSVKSETPPRKFFTFSRRPISSGSPRKRFSTAADQRRFSAGTAERENALVMDRRSPKVLILGEKTEQNLICQELMEVPEATATSKVTECESANSRPQENTKSTLIKLTKQKSENPEILERKLSLSRTVDHKAAAANTSDRKISLRGTGCQELVDIPEENTQQDTESVTKTVSVSSTILDKETELAAKSISNSDNFENSEKKHKLIREVRDTETENVPDSEIQKKDSPIRMMKTKPISCPASSPSRRLLETNSETQMNDSVRSTPGRMKKTHFSLSPASSPSRVCKTHGKSGTPSDDSPGSPPAGMNKTMPGFSQAYSPSRPSRTCASLKASSVSHSKEHSSPISSTITPCWRLGRQSSLPATMSWQELQ